jgi:hypothetical protein
VVLDFRLERLVFEILGLRMTTEEAALLIELLDMIYASRVPVTLPGARG